MRSFHSKDTPKGQKSNQREDESTECCLVWLASGAQGWQVPPRRGRCQRRRYRPCRAIPLREWAQTAY